MLRDPESGSSAAGALPAGVTTGGERPLAKFDWLGRGSDEPSPPAANSAEEIIARVEAERRRERIMAEDARRADDGMWLNGWPHEAPARPLSVHEAHLTTQRHRECPMDRCPRKRAAWRTLIEAGRVTPDSSRTHAQTFRAEHDR
jgi:hypothetical protein